jgi:probable rRNA maturation factor
MPCRRRACGSVKKRCRIEWEGDTAGLDLRLVQRAVDAALAEDGLEKRLLVVRLVGDADSAALHRAHFNDPEPTDVMTFPDGSPDPESGLLRLGDLAVGLEVARRVAAERGRQISEEVALYVLHGVLHLLGHDDVAEADRLAMWAIQRRIMGGLGSDIGPA